MSRLQRFVLFVAVSSMTQVPRGDLVRSNLGWTPGAQSTTNLYLTLWYISKNSF